eukprot:jgi/Tetstr1/448770/TSEL_036005.t1
MFAEFSHDSENISPFDATTAADVRHIAYRLRKGAAFAANAIPHPPHGRVGAQLVEKSVVLDYIDPNVLALPGVWFFFSSSATWCTFPTSKLNKTPQQ